MLPTLRNNAAAGYQGPVKIELLKVTALLDQTKDITFSFRIPLSLRQYMYKNSRNKHFAFVQWQVVSSLFWVIQGSKRKGASLLVSLKEIHRLVCSAVMNVALKWNVPIIS